MLLPEVTIPLIFDHLYPGPVQIITGLASEIEKMCTAMTKIKAIACSWPPMNFNGLCTIFIPQEGIGGVGHRTYDWLLRYENARCNGWRF